jgi:catechol 2,3-dioxygenase
LRIGHVHLRVGDVAQAEAFYRDTVGLDVTRRRPGASFMSSGRYHHHIAANVWHSAGAGRRDPARAGLSWIGLETVGETTLTEIRKRLAQADIEIVESACAIEAADPWGTRLRITQS